MTRLGKLEVLVLVVGVLLLVAGILIESNAIVTVSGILIGGAVVSAFLGTFTR